MRDRLDPVLRLRRRAEQVRARALAVAVRERELAGLRLQTLRSQRDESRRTLIETGLQGGTGGHLLLAALLAEQSAIAAGAQVARLEAARSREDAARRAAVTAAQQRRAIERVIELRRAEVVRDVQAAEQRRLDDVANTRSARRLVRGGV
jgi:flagellar export protein FliJ